MNSNRGLKILPSVLREVTQDNHPTTKFPTRRLTDLKPHKMNITTPNTNLAHLEPTQLLTEHSHYFAFPHQYQHTASHTPLPAYPTTPALALPPQAPPAGSRNLP
jgi:hypothetical protein